METEILRMLIQYLMYVIAIMAIGGVAIITQILFDACEDHHNPDIDQKIKEYWEDEDK